MTPAGSVVALDPVGQPPQREAGFVAVAVHHPLDAPTQPAVRRLDEDGDDADGHETGQRVAGEELRRASQSTSA